MKKAINYYIQQKENTSQKIMLFPAILGTIMTLALLLVSIIELQPTTPKCAVFSAEDYLRAPSMIVATSTELYVYDEYTDKIDCYEITATSSSPLKLRSSGVIDLVDIITYNDSIYCLYRAGSVTKVGALNSTDMTITEFSFTAGYTLSATSFATDGTYFYFLNTNKSVHNFTLESTTFTFVKSDDLSSTTIAITGEITKLRCTDTYFYLLSEDEIIYRATKVFPFSTTAEVDLSADESKKITDIDILSNNLYYTTKRVDNLASELKSPATSLDFQTNSHRFDNLCTNDDYLFISDTANRKVYKFNQSSATLATHLQNELPTPTLLTPTALYQAKITAPTKFYASIDATAELGELPAETTITILSSESSVPNYYYCLCTKNNVNTYSYIEKTVSIEISRGIETSEQRKVIGESIKLYTYPSTTTDTQNLVVTNLEAMTIVNKISDKEYTNADGKKFALIKTANNKTGFIESKTLATISNIQQEKLKCDARTVRETKIYASSDGTDEIYTIAKNTRLTLNEVFDKNATCVKITYQLEDGTTIIGYCLTRDIKPDGLSTLQILGIVLIGINIIFTIVLLLVLKKFRRLSTPRPSSTEISRSAKR